MVSFGTRFFPPLPSRGRCVSPKARWKPGCPETVARQPRVHTLKAGQGLFNMAALDSSSTSPLTLSPTSLSPTGPPPTPPPTSNALSKSPLESKDSSPSPVARSACLENSLPLAVFYGPLDAKNPLLASCEREIRELLGFMKRKKALAITEEQKHEFHRLW